MRTEWRPALVALLLFTLITGVIYPLLVTAGGQLLFPRAASGSLVVRHDSIVGSSLIGQEFSSPKYFWGRISATSPVPYNASASSGSNLGPSNPALVAEVAGRLAALHAVDSTNSAPVPIDLVTSSGSGLDPEISPAAAVWQAGRVARARGLPEATVLAAIQRATRPRFAGLLGEPGVNVLLLNLALDTMTAPR